MWGGCRRRVFQALIVSVPAAVPLPPAICRVLTSDGRVSTIMHELMVECLPWQARSRNARIFFKARHNENTSCI